MLEVTDLHFNYVDKSLLQNINLRLQSGELLHLRGENGVGKTTLLKLIAGIFQPHQGDIRYSGEAIANNLSQYQQQLCYIGHKTGVSQLLTVQEYCDFELQRAQKQIETTALLKQFSLNEQASTICGLLSVGQRRRVGLLRLYISNAPLWLIDEPFVGLDNTAITTFNEIFRQHCAAGGGIILTSHQLFSFPKQYYREYSL